MNKICVKCREVKPSTIDNFIFNICRECNKKRQREWYQKNKKILYKKNKQRRLIYGKDRINQWRQKWILNNKEKNKEIIRKSSLRWYYKNKEFAIDQGKKRSKIHTKNMTDKYIKFLITKKSSYLKSNDIPPELVQAYRLNLILKRLIRKKGINY